MLREDLLIEIGTEELPPTALKTLATALADNLQLQLAKANINFTSVKWFATPRRLAVLFTETDTKQVDVVVEKRGPAVKAAFDQDGNATKAALGWARGNGIEVSQASRLVTDKGEWLLHNATVIGKHLKDVIHPLIDTALNQLPIPKPMRWGSNDVQFIRPIKSICVMAGEQLLSGKVFNIEVSRTLQGHRFHGDQQFELAHANQYEQQLQQQYVVADFEKRKSMIQQQVSVLEQSSDARADFDDTLLEEVTALVEWPVTLCANFDERFLAVPKEALIYTMKGDQKYFPLLDEIGRAHV